MTSDKITPEHLARTAIVYIRQSTVGQVRHNLESQRRQYELADRARAMGWRQVDVIDEDLGRSGATAATRSGFGRLVASVGLQEVGAVFSLEASRLARNNRDWYQLLDLCALMDTLIVDFDGVYNPRLMNDRLLLGLKGTMSEFELGLIRQRAHEALRQMVQRGALYTTLPIGYVRSEDGRCEKDPDLRIQHAVQSVFEKFAECGSARQVLLWFRGEGIPLPTVAYGTHGREVVWKLPRYGTIHKFLTNPIYAGAYAFGRTETRTRLVGEHPVKIHGYQRAREAWDVLIRDHHAPYISWATYERTQGQLRENARVLGGLTRGPARRGPSLLASLLRCARCGRKLHVAYSGSDGKVLRYACLGGAINHGTGKCIAFGGRAVDAAIERELLTAVEPAAVEAALAALATLEGERDARRTALELAHRQAIYEADRARRQYDAVEPEHRLVAAELENRWDAALQEVQRLDEQLAALSIPAQPLAADERTALMALSEDLPAVWDDPTTDMAMKKRLIRTMIEEILADVDDAQATVTLVIRWAGGCHTRLHVKKHRTGEHRHRTDRDVVDLMRDLAQVAPDRDIASILNRLGMKTGRGNNWTEVRVRAHRSWHGIPAYVPGDLATKSWVTMQDAAAYLGISPMSVRRLIACGIIPAKQIVTHAPWVIERAVLEREEIQRTAGTIKQGRRSPLPENPDQENLDFRPLVAR
jgi:DNA invertase Pin-like site-specific DNA recombinase